MVLELSGWSGSVVTAARVYLLFSLIYIITVITILCFHPFSATPSVLSSRDQEAVAAARRTLPASSTAARVVTAAAGRNENRTLQAGR